jgi:Domain of unknown function (DUF4440)
VIPERDGHLGSKAPLGQSAGHFQSTPIIGRLRCRPPLRKRANCGPSFHSGPVDSGVAFKRAGPAMAPDVMALFEPTMEGSMSKRTPTRRILSGLALASLMLLTVCGSARAGTIDEVRVLFSKFVTAQNAHDLKAIGEILLDSPQFLWITRDPQSGRPSPFWGRDAALKRFEQYYQGTWKLEPKLDETKITELSPGVAQLVAPTLISIAPAGQTAQPSLFLLSHIYVKTDAGWRLASIFPILVP